MEKMAKSVKEVRVYKDGKIVEWTNARKGQQFQVLDPNGYHYRYCYDAQAAEGCIDAAQQWGW